MIGLETDNAQLKVWDVIEDAFLFIFAGELLLKIIVYGVVSYFNWNGVDFSWNVFDFLIVSFGGMDFAMGVLFGSEGDGGGALRPSSASFACCASFAFSALSNS